MANCAMHVSNDCHMEDPTPLLMSRSFSCKQWKVHKRLNFTLLNRVVARYGVMMIMNKVNLIALGNDGYVHTIWKMYQFFLENK